MSLVAAALADLEHEMANTRKMLERIPEGQLDFTPHDKSWPLGKLASHVADFGEWGAMTLNSSELDLAEPSPPRAPLKTAGDFVAKFDAGHADFKAALASVTDEQLMQTWTLRHGSHVILAMPRLGVLRSMVISHMIHHRAQLSIYYRLVNVSLPGLYGPSADEQ